MTQSMTKLGRATCAGAFTAMLAIIGVIAVMASVKTAGAWDQQAGDAEGLPGHQVTEEQR